MAKTAIDADGGTGCTQLSRRQFLTGVAAAAGALALSGCGSDDGSPSDPESNPLPSPERSGIEHVVVVMMENRSFDHFLGWVPGADGRQAGLAFPDKQGAMQETFPLAPNFQNCQFADPDHSYYGGRLQFDDGHNDGWLHASTNDVFPIGYYTRDDLAFYGQAVPQWTTFDRYFAAILAPTFPNRLYLHAGQTDRLINSTKIPVLPTIWDRLAEQGLTGSYYYSDVPFLALWGSTYAAISQPLTQFFVDAAAGNLANVSYIDPRFNGEDAGTSNDDHPLADIRNGQAFLSQIYDAVTSSPNWPDTVLVINYDEWGGFFDHVPPPLAPQTDQDRRIGNDGRLGFRVPCLLVSPLARRGFVAHEQYDHTSILSMIEWRWGLDALSMRDETANNLAFTLDFTRRKNLRAPPYSVPQGPFGEMCTPATAALRAEFGDLQDLGVRYRFRIPAR